MATTVEASGLRRHFGGTKALDGLDLSVEAGTIVGLLGPNGAGKSTAVRVLTTLLRPDGGRATVAGYDVVDEAPEVRRTIGLAGQYAALDEALTGRPANLFDDRSAQPGIQLARGQPAICPAAGAVRPDRHGQPLAQDVLGWDASPSGSGRPRWWPGHRGPLLRRAHHRAGPPDPPGHVGCDREFVGDGTTVLRTTQYLEEADHLADRVMVIDGGRVIAEGTRSAEDKRRRRTDSDHGRS